MPRASSSPPLDLSSVDPQLAAWLRERAIGEAPNYRELPVAEARALAEQGTASVVGPRVPLRRVEDLTLDGVPARLYAPAAIAGDGVLVWSHGGGWVLGSLDTHDDLCRRLAASSKRPVLSVAYRLAPEHLHPAALEDAWSATAWALERFKSVAIGGDSAGGHLAALSALRARDRDIEIALQVLAVPITDFCSTSGSYADYADGFGLTASLMEWFWNTYLPKRVGVSDDEVAPLRARDVSGLAPALVVTAGHDPLRDEGEAYAARLRDAGVAVEHVRYPTAIHGFLRMNGVTSVADDAVALIAEAVERALGGVGPGRRDG